MAAYQTQSALKKRTYDGSRRVLHKVLVILVEPCDLKQIDHIVNIVFSQSPRHDCSCKIRMTVVIKIIAGQHLVNYLAISIICVSTIEQVRFNNSTYRKDRISFPVNHALSHPPYQFHTCPRPTSRRQS